MGGESVVKLPPAVVCCLGGLLHYLSEFKLDRVLGLTSNFWRFSSPSHMMMDASTLINLEVLQNQDDHTEQGSLLWLLRRTKTAFGARLLRHWVTHPLLDKERILARHDAVDELMEDPPAIEAIAKHLKGIPDLERALTRLHYSKCSPNELVAVLRAFIKVGELARDAKQEADSLRSSLLGWLVRGMPEPSSKLEAFLNEMDLKAACATSNSGKAEPDTRNLLKGYKIKSQYPSIYAIKQGVSEVEDRLQEHLIECRRILGLRDLEYKTVLTSSLLLEVPNSATSRVPKSWIKINGTTKAGRYHSPEIQELQQELNRLHERLAAETNVAWQEFQARVAECYGQLHSVVQRLAVLDCLLSLADVAKTGGWCRPTLYDDHQLRVVGGRHPMVDALMGSGYVPNGIDLNHSGQVAMVITGPNMGGKSSYMRQTALLVIMAQVR
jgi:DNA mismatch repair protein MSH3